MQEFNITDLQDIKLFLGIKIIRTESTLMFNQTAYLNAVLNKFNMNKCNRIIYKSI